MSDELKLYRGIGNQSLDDLNFDGTFHLANFRLPRFEPAKTLSPLEGIFDQNHQNHLSFKLFGPRRTASDLTSREKHSIDLSSQCNRSTFTSVHEFKLRRHIYDGDTVRPLPTLSSHDLKRLQVQNIENSLADKIHGSNWKSTTEPKNSEPNSNKHGGKCLELWQNKRVVIIVAIVFLFLVLLAVALGVGIYFGVTNKHHDITTTAHFWPQNSSTQTSRSETSKFITAFENFTNDYNHSMTITAQPSTDGLSEKRNSTRPIVTELKSSTERNKNLQTDRASSMTSRPMTKQSTITTQS